MIGLTEPTSGTAFIEGLDIGTQMDEIYTSMGVCPQHEYVSYFIMKYMSLISCFPVHAIWTYAFSYDLVLSAYFGKH